MQLFYKYQSLLYKIILFLAMILCVVYLFPRGGGFKYAFQKGKPWQYETLLAPFDFPVAKSQQEIELEKKTVQNESPLIFRFDNSAQFVSQQSTSSWIGQQLSSKDSALTLKQWERYLKNLYVPAMVDIDFAARKSRPVLLLQDNQAQSFLFADLNTNDSLPLTHLTLEKTGKKI